MLARNFKEAAQDLQANNPNWEPVGMLSSSDKGTCKRR